MERVTNIDNAVYALYNKKPKLFEDVVFMKKLIMINLKYIIYDKTNNEELYKVFANEVLKFLKDNKKLLDEKAERELGSGASINSLISQYQMLIEELNNPKMPADGIYKIPHKFLFELVRNEVLQNIHNNYRYKLSIFDINLYSYFGNDCNFSLSYGKKLEELYLNPDVILYTAGATIDAVEKIFQEGYQVNYSGCLDANFYDPRDVGLGFMSMLPVGAYGRSDKIFAVIPKNAKNILGSDGEVGRYSNDPSEWRDARTYLRPEYIVGCNRYVNGEAVFIENNIPIEERKKYKNYGDGDASEFTYVDKAITEINSSAKSR